MANLKCPKCQQATASIYKRKDLSAAFAPEALGVVIPATVLAAIVTAVKELIGGTIKEGAAWLRDRERLYGVCKACGHLWEIE
jgi:Zn finger protein HypA/HybF involved in hydrogenase expression